MSYILLISSATFKEKSQSMPLIFGITKNPDFLMKRLIIIFTLKGESVQNVVCYSIENECKLIIYCVVSD